MEVVIGIFLALLALYFGIGLVFGLYFLIVGAVRIDPVMEESKWRVRLLLFPGTVAVWPFLLKGLKKPKS